MSTKGVFNEVQRFVEEHESCGELVRLVQPPTSDGYRLTITCSCGVILDRWVTPEAARHDLIHSSLLSGPN